MNDKQLLESMIGKTIESVTVNESENDDAVDSFIIYFTDRSTIDIGCTSYNYGNQNLIVSE